MLTTFSTTVTAKSIQAAMPFDVVELHCKHGKLLRAELCRQGVNYLELDDAYSETIARILDKAPTEYDAGRSAPHQWAWYKVREISVRQRQRQMAQQRHEVSGEDMIPDELVCRDGYHYAAVAPEGESMAAVSEFLDALSAALRPVERDTLRHVGVEGLRADLAERTIAAAQLGISEDSLRKRLVGIRKVAAELWPTYFDSAVPA